MHRMIWIVFIVWFCVLGLFINLVAFVDITVPFWFVLFFTAFTLIFTSVLFIWFTQDYFHPVSIFVFSFLIRLWFPAFLVMVGVEPYPFLGTEWWVGDAWQKGFILGALANFTLILGWVLLPAGLKRRALTAVPDSVHRNSHKLPALRRAAWMGFGVGLAFYLFFFITNFGILGSIDVLLSGVLRGGKAQLPGTSRYMFLARNFLTWSSLILSVIMYQSTGSLFGGLLPLLTLSLLYIPFGGRVVAVIPLFMGLMALWYSGWRGRRGFRAILLALMLVIGSIYIAPSIRAYRGGGGINALLEALSPSVVLHDNILFWLETSMLHAYTYGVVFGPGSHTVSLLRYLFGGYTGYFLGISDEIVHGTYIVWRVTGVKPDWGIHTGLPVDYYMSFGLVPTMGAMLLLGWILKLLYHQLVLSRRDRSVVRLTVYVFIFWNFYWLVYERGLGLLTVYEGLVFLALILLAAELLQGHQLRGTSQGISFRTYFGH